MVTPTTASASTPQTAIQAHGRRFGSARVVGAQSAVGPGVGWDGVLMKPGSDQAFSSVRGAGAASPSGAAAPSSIAGTLKPMKPNRTSSSGLAGLKKQNGRYDAVETPSTPDM